MMLYDLTWSCLMLWYLMWSSYVRPHLIWPDLLLNMMADLNWSNIWSDMRYFFLIPDLIWYSMILFDWFVLLCSDLKISDLSRLYQIRSDLIVAATIWPDYIQSDQICYGVTRESITGSDQIWYNQNKPQPTRPDKIR